MLLLKYASIKRRQSFSILHQLFNPVNVNRRLIRFLFLHTLQLVPGSIYMRRIELAHNGFQREGYCGLYCGACPKFLASENDTQEDTRCQGCKSAVVAGWCQTCTLKACARNKGLAFCGECDLYPCADLQAFIDDVRYPYHSLVPLDLGSVVPSVAPSPSRAVREHCYP